jgi:Xaa-Pro aminopeptidase
LTFIVAEQQRLSNLRQQLDKQKLDALLVTNRENIRYLSGFTGSSGMLLVNDRQVFLLTDSRYTIQAQQEAPDTRLELGGNLLEQLEQLLRNLKLSRLGFEADHLTYNNYDKISHICRQKGLELVASQKLVADLRLIKEPEEINHIKQAVAIAETAFPKIIKQVKPGIQEKELALELEFATKHLGSGKPPFDIIVASGTRSAMPHGVASDKAISPGELIIFDFGASYKGYNSDITRTLLWGTPSPRQTELYEIVYAAQAEAIAGVKPGMSAAEVDKIARGVIEQAGYGEYFGHGTGHGVGLEIHEAPYINQKSQARLIPGMVFTIEPGVYLPETGGVRIEDMVLVTEDGCEVLTDLPKELNCN